jgi:hypothetical protein
VPGTSYPLLGFDAFVFQWLIAAAMMIWWTLYLLNALELAMPLDETARNSAPALGGLLVIAATFLYARSVRRQTRIHRTRARHPAARHPAE